MRNGFLRLFLFVSASALTLFAFPATASADSSLSFDGINDYLQIPTNPLPIFGTGDFSVEFLLRRDPGQPTGYMVSKWDALGDVGWGIQALGSGPFRFETNSYAVDTDIVVTDGAWHNVIAVREGGTLKMYVDGALHGSNANASPPVNVDTTEPLFIGGFTFPEWASYAAVIVDELRLYNRALSESEALAHFNRIYGNESGQIGYWALDEGAGTTVSDNANQWALGTVSGATWVGGAPSPQAPGFLETTSYPPGVETIDSPKKNTTYATDTLAVTYKTGDPNDALGQPDYGLAKDPVSLFFSDDSGDTWNPIVEGLPEDGTYAWDITQLRDNAPYHLKVFVVDKKGLEDDAITGPFLFDRSAPQFDVAVTPPFTKGEDVHIVIEATEELAAPPTVTIRQARRDRPTIETPTGAGKHFELVYKIIPGFDGIATISINGQDINGNNGAFIRSGGTFAIGILPPPRPIITSPLNQEIVTSSPITIRGSTRPDTKALFTLNGKVFGTGVPDETGIFLISDVPLSEIFNNGLNILQFAAEDAGGARSDTVTIYVKYNLDPTIAILEPKDGSVLSGIVTVRFAIKDPNADIILLHIEVSDDSGLTWQTLVENHKTINYRWNTQDLPDGTGYLLRVTANDGYTKATTQSGLLTLQNLAPSISFSAPGAIHVNRLPVRVEGFAETPTRGRPRTIALIEYSTDQGKTWQNAEASDGAFDGIHESFWFLVDGIEEGITNILVRATDSRKTSRQAVQRVIFDTKPPAPPVVLSPEPKSVFGDREDANAARAGAQVILTGTAEPQSTIVASIDTATFQGSTDRTGRFRIEISLLTHGENILKLSVIDVAGNKSASETLFPVISNNPPSLRFLRPKIGAAVGGVFDLAFEIQDRDLDPVKEAALSYRALPSGKPILLSRNVQTGTSVWDVRRLREGSYELLLEASDGVSSDTLSWGVVVDNTPPTASFTPLKGNLFNKSFELGMTGAARDNLSGVETVEYTIDDAQWFKGLITGGYRTTSAAFRVRHPFALKDGTYTVRFRATDVAGNVSAPTSPQSIIVDTTPPRVGSYTLSYGNLIFFPEKNTFRIIAPLTLQFTLSLEKDTEQTELRVGEIPITLEKKGSLWRGSFTLSAVGEFPMSIVAEDAAGNRSAAVHLGTIRTISLPRITSQSQGVAGVKINVFHINPDDQSRTFWDAKAWDLRNPVTSGNDGAYILLLPPGSYELRLEKESFQKLRTSRIDIASPRFVTTNLTLTPQPTLRDFFRKAGKRIGL